MRLLIMIIAFASILHSVSAIPRGVPFPFFSLDGLPGCARDCKILREAAANCQQPSVPVSEFAAYVQCHCQSPLLNGGNSDSRICPQSCNAKDDASIKETYKALCGFPGPSATLFLFVPGPSGPTTSQTSTSTPTPSSPTVSITTTLTTAPTHMFAPTLSRQTSAPSPATQAFTSSFATQTSTLSLASQTSTPTPGEPKNQPELSETQYVNTTHTALVLELT